MLDPRKTLLICCSLAVSLAACSTSSQNQTSPTSPTDSPAISATTSPSPQNTDTAASTTNAAEKRFAQEIQLLQTLKSGKVGATTKIPVSVKNTSNFLWDSAGANPVNFSYNWFDSNGKRVVFDGTRTPLPKTLAPEDAEKLNAVIVFPDRPGNYSLTLTMVQENVAWFNDAGAPAPKIPVTVTSK